jgi:hypothetical protein
MYFMEGTIYISYYLWKARKSEVRVSRVSIGMSNEYCVKKTGEKGWE